MANKGKLQFEKPQENGASLNRKLSATSRLSRTSRLVSSLSALSYGKSLAWRGGGGDGFKVPKYQNSYRLEPHLPFCCEISDRILAQVMTSAFADITYNPESSVMLCRETAADILDRLYKKTHFDRVKYIVMITMIENASQSFECVHSRLWDVDRDSYSMFVVEQRSFYAYGTVHAINYE
ncbi:dynein light chain Tctex-type protein 2B [Phymastichus coffea]|uniref:dynein light chain Tctex-type protein 2B n=1 Tax=Phymastichus coffea TaxID=108790 RepID=UPI00273B952B|nr:dynein light chain Tctex-type protein 2B [Phymastichus coffea]